MTDPSRTELFDLRDKVAAALAAAEDLYHRSSDVSFRLTSLIRHLREASALAGKLADTKPDVPVSCGVCSGGELYDFLGHDALGHRVANALARQGVHDSDDLKSRSWAWVSGTANIGAAGLSLIFSRVGAEAYREMKARGD